MSRLIITGISADICVLFTAADAHMRDYDIWVLEDCVTASTSARKRWAMETMATAFAAETWAYSPNALRAWLARAKPR